MGKTYLPSSSSHFWKACSKAENGCWHYAYPFFTSYQDRVRLAHRLAWELSHKTILTDKTILVFQRCGDRLCVNPKHLYLGSSKDIISKQNTPKDFWKRVDKKTGPVLNRRIGRCWNWTGAVFNKGGYGQAHFKGKAYPAQRLAWILTNGGIPPGRLACHICDNPLCCRPSHLFLGTPKENTTDMIRKGRQRGGTHAVSAEARAKISVAMKGKQLRLGAKLSAETKAKIGNANRGRKHTPEVKAKMSASRIGHTATEDAKAKMRAAWKRRKLNH